MVTKEEVISALDNMNPAELGALISDLESVWGVKVPRGFGVQGPKLEVIEEEEQTEFTVELTSFPGDVAVIDGWLVCEHIGKGMFSDEVSVEIARNDGAKAWFFLNSEDVDERRGAVRAKLENIGAIVWATLPTEDRAAVAVSRSQVVHNQGRFEKSGFEGIGRECSKEEDISKDQVQAAFAETVK